MNDTGGSHEELKIPSFLKDKAKDSGSIFPQSHLLEWMVGYLNLWPNTSLDCLCAETRGDYQELANGNNRAFSPPLLKEVVSTYHKRSHDSDRWQSSWQHSTLFHCSLFSSSSSSCSFAAMEVCCVLKCWIIIHLGRHTAYCKTGNMCEGREFWAWLLLPVRRTFWIVALLICWHLQSKVYHS